MPLPFRLDSCLIIWLKNPPLILPVMLKNQSLITDFVGTPLLFITLSAIGRDDLAFVLLTRKEYLSWLYPVTQGATTILERWDGQKPDGSFQDPIRNSFNHYVYGAIGEWLYIHVAGIFIDVENPGYKYFYLSPHPGGGLTHAKSKFSSMYGLIKSAWQIKKRQFNLRCCYPGEYHSHHNFNHG